MRTRLTLLLTLLLILAALAAPSGASAGTIFGDTCIADRTQDGGEFAAFNIAAPGNPLPVAAPAAGVITSWSVPLISPYPGPVEQVLKVIRAAGPERVQLVAEAVGTVQGTSNVFAARIPVKAGDRLGLAGRDESVVFGCDLESELALLGVYVDDPVVPVGGIVGTTEASVPFRIPVSATLERDGDGDGFGDDSQDRCPTSAALQIACPVVPPTPPSAPLVIDSLALRGKGKVIVYAAVPVTVSGKVKLPRRKAGKRGKRKAKASAQAKLRAVTKAVAPGKLTRFTLRLTRRVKRYLKALPRRKKLTLALTASAGGGTATDATKLRLKGQAKQRRRGKR